MKYEKNQCFTVRILDYSDEGLGIGRAFSQSADAEPGEGITVFVKDTVIGDLVRVRLTKVKKTYAYARLEQVLEESPDRVRVRCPDAARCGGCQIQMMDYEASLEWKTKKVRDALVRIGGFSDEEADRLVKRAIGMNDPWHYRNKAQYPVGTDKEGRPVTGFYAARTHDIIPRLDCPIGDPANEKILSCILDVMRSLKITAYDEVSGRGDIRHVMIRSSRSTGQIMVCLVAARRNFPGREVLAERLMQISDVAGVSVNVNPDRTNVILGKETVTIAGEDHIVDRIGGVDFRISPRSFYQVNPQQTQVLYGLAVEFAGLTGKETVWDLYCGIGTITLSMAQSAKEVFGVEIIPEAIADAQENAALNGIENARFFVGKAEEVLPEKYENEGIRADVIVVDPPRKGCDRAVLDTMIRMQPERIVYVSCNPATLARDLEILREGGYETLKVQPVDMFPHTVHVENVCLLWGSSQNRSTAIS